MIQQCSVVHLFIVELQFMIQQCSVVHLFIVELQFMIQQCSVVHLFIVELKRQHLIPPVFCQVAKIRTFNPRKS